MNRENAKWKQFEKQQKKTLYPAKKFLRSRLGDLKEAYVAKLQLKAIFRIYKSPDVHKASHDNVICMAIEESKMFLRIIRHIGMLDWKTSKKKGGRGASRSIEEEYYDGNIGKLSNTGI